MVRRLIAHHKVIEPFHRHPVVSEALPQLIRERLRVGPEQRRLAGRIATKRKAARRIDFPDRLLHEVATFRTTRREIQRVHMPIALPQLQGNDIPRAVPLELGGEKPVQKPLAFGLVWISKHGAMPSFQTAYQETVRTRAGCGTAGSART